MEPLLYKLVLQTLDDEDLGFIGVVEHPLHGVTPTGYAARHEV
jgi:hypothetical protein